MAKITHSEKFNTNNNWGFGGGVGVARSYSNGYRSRCGTSSYRHAPPEKFAHYWDANDNRISAANFLASINKGE